MNMLERERESDASPLYHIAHTVSPQLQPVFQFSIHGPSRWRQVRHTHMAEMGII